MTRPTLDQALQVARDLGACGDCFGEGIGTGSLTPLGKRCGMCGTTGVVGDLSPDVVTWLARLALHHPQVSAAVAAALPSSRWLMPWSTAAWPHERVGANGVVVAQVQPDGDRWEWRVGDMGGWHHALTADAARADVDERLIAAGYTLLGEVYRRASTALPEPGPPSRDTCARCGGNGHDALFRCTNCGEPCRDCNGYGWADIRAMTDPCRRCDGTGMVPRG